MMDSEPSKATPVSNARNGLRIRLATYVASTIVFLGVCSIPPLVILCLFPLAVVFALPALSLLLLTLATVVPQLAYLVLAQTDAPLHATSPFLTTSISRCFKIDYAVFMWLRQSLNLAMRFTGDWARRKYTRNSVGIHMNESYGSPRHGAKFDVYTPDHIVNSLKPIVVFIPPQIRPFSSSKWFFSSLGINLAKTFSVVVVIPDLTPYPEGRIYSQVCEARLVLRYINENAARYGGDRTQIFLSGHGLGALVALLLPLQQSICESRDAAIRTGSEARIPNGVATVKVYAGDISIPALAGLILFAPITDIDAHIMHEGERGIHHLSIVRRVCGPGQLASYLHSPAHLLFASRSIVDVQLLPQRVIFLHGGLDVTVRNSQSELMKELFHGVGVSQTFVRIFPVGHWGIITSLMFGMNGPISMALTTQLQQFIYPSTDHEATPKTLTTKADKYRI